MPRESRDNFTYIEVSRPVIDGMYKFCDKVRYHGNEVFGDEISALVPDYLPTTPDDGTEDDQAGPVLRGVGHPRLTVYDLEQLRLPLLEQRATPEMRYENRFGQHVRIFTAHENGRKKQGSPHLDEKGEALHAALYQAGLQYDVVDQSWIEVSCQAMALNSDGDLNPSNGKELALVPDPQEAVTLMLVDQADLCFRGLANHSSKSVRPSGPFAPNIPFARLPVDMTRDEQKAFFERLSALLPVRVVLGGIRTRLNMAS